MKFEVTPLNQFTYTLNGVTELVNFLTNNIKSLPDPIIVACGDKTLTIYHVLLLDTPKDLLIKAIQGMVKRRK